MTRIICLIYILRKESCTLRSRWLPGWLAGWLAGCLAGWLIVLLVALLVGLLSRYLVGSLFMLSSLANVIIQINLAFTMITR